MHATAVLGYLPKLLRGLGQAFATHFLYNFSIKMFFIWYSIYWQGSIVIPFFLPKNQTKHVIEFLFRQLMTSWTLRFIIYHPLKQWSTGRKRGTDRNTKIWISREQKELLNEIKSIFHSFWRAINIMKTVDRNFKWNE